MRSDESLSPGEFGSSVVESITNIVLQWQLNAIRAALERRMLQSTFPALNGFDGADDINCRIDSHPLPDF